MLSSSPQAGRALARDLLLHMLGELPKKKVEVAGRRYAKALEMDPGNWRNALQRLPRLDKG
jgi:predicted transcriptional regulator